MNQLLFILLITLFAPQVLPYSYSGKLTSDSFLIGEPEQVALSLGSSPESCVVSWVATAVPNPAVIFYESTSSDSDTGSAYYAEVFVEGGDSSIGYASLFTENRCGTTRLMSSVYIENCSQLPAGYKVRNLQTTEGSGADKFPVNDFSDLFCGRIPGTPTSTTSSSIALVADMSDYMYSPGEYVSSIPAMTEAALNGEIDLVIHGGDIAYDIDDDCGRRGDEFMRTIQPLSTTVPYIFGVGDHEGGRKDLSLDCHAQLGYDYEGFRMRVGEATNAGQMIMAHASGSPTSFYFSFDVGLVHFVVINTNAWIHACHYWMLPPQMMWLSADLAAVNKSRTPWTVLIAHRAIYCVKNDDSECNTESEAMRYGLPELAYKKNINIGDWNGEVKGQNNVFGIEEVLEKYGVDIVFGGHTHHYERSYPARDGESVQKDYVNPEGTVFVVGGISGVGEDAFEKEYADFTAWRDETYRESWGHLNCNSTHAVWTQRLADSGGVLDQFTISKI
ncbi:hypothetical protein TrVE_jg1389 [Triparma verrucosa]|uniref:Calcineurin-like phosphoesterase domain-containing protein n=1 Tax=Triparma verrucosa TaxID=1606542 RepID=A0A9W7FD93_9STRA|nr:hypothetical protein TrVE_jg1389 [Triparma verrucosa]